jgi:hypothetical protein
VRLAVRPCDALAAAPEAVDSQFACDWKRRNPAMWSGCVEIAITRLRTRDPEARDVANQARLARLYVAQSQWDAGRRALESVTSSRPQLSRPWANLGFVDFTLGNFDSAEVLSRRPCFWMEDSVRPVHYWLASSARMEMKTWLPVSKHCARYAERLCGRDTPPGWVVFTRCMVLLCLTTFYRQAFLRIAHWYHSDIGVRR